MTKVIRATYVEWSGDSDLQTYTEVVFIDCSLDPDMFNNSAVKFERCIFINCRIMSTLMSPSAIKDCLFLRLDCLPMITLVLKR